MIKNLAYFPLQSALNSGPVLSAVLDCIKENGIATVENSMHADAAVIWSVLWAGRMQANRAVYEHYRSQNKPVIIIEIGCLHRGSTWKIAVNNITANGYYGHTDNLDWDRPAKLGIVLKKLEPTQPYIVVAAQHGRSLQVQNINMQQWIKDVVQSLKQYTDRPVVVRPHPRSKLAAIPGIDFQWPQKITGTYDSYDLNFDCHAVVNYNSGPGVQAAIAGTRCIVDSSSLAHPVSIQYSDIEQRYTVDRDLWLTQICHTEYTLDEIKQGLWLKRILPALQA